MKTKKLISVVGATAVGKTKYAVELAKKYQTEIISCDSRQFFKELKIGSAIPTEEEMQGIIHHFIGNKSIIENYNIGDYEKEAKITLQNLFKKYNIVILVGGSGLYEKALVEGLDELPDVPKEIREKINEDYSKLGISFLQEQLKEKDLLYFQKVDVFNPHRIIRALEIFEHTGKSILEFQNKKNNTQEFNIERIGLTMEREKLYERINIRVEEMLKNGFLDEVSSLVEYKNQTALKTVGYNEFFQFLENKLTYNQAVEEMKKNTRRYAKRQLTWFRKIENINWIEV